MRVFGFVAHVVPAFAVLLCLMAVPATNAMAQAETSRTLVGGQTVTWAAPWLLDEELTSSGEGFDLLGLSTPLGVVGVGSYGYQISGSNVRDIAIEAFAGEVALTQVDRGDYGDVSYSLDIASPEGLAFGIFTLVVERSSGTLLSIMMAPVAAFQGQMESAQATVTIDGTAIFDGVDAAVMQGFLNNADPSEGRQQTPPTAAPTQPTPTGQGAALSNSFTIPVTGVSVAYSDDWVPANPTPDTLRLDYAQLDARIVVLGTDTNLPATSTAESWSAALLNTDEFATMSAVATVEVEPGVRWYLIFSEPDGAGLYYLVMEVTGAANGSTMTSMNVGGDSLDAAVELASSTVSIDGQPVFRDLKQHVPELFDTSSAPPAPTATVGTAPTQPAPTAAAGSGGLVGGINAGLGGPTPTPPSGSGDQTPAASLPNSFAIPSNGAIVSWSDDWQALDTIDNGIQIQPSTQPTFLNVTDSGPGFEANTAAEFAEMLQALPAHAGSDVMYAVDVPGDSSHKIVVLSHVDNVGTVLVLFDINVVPESMTYLALPVYQHDLATVVPFVTFTVQVNGTPAFGDWQQLVPELFSGERGASSETVFANSYVIPASGVQVAWTDEWSVAEQDERTIKLESSSAPAFLRVLDAGGSSTSSSAADLAQSILDQTAIAGAKVVYAVDSPADPNRKVFVVSEPGAIDEIYRIYDLALGPQSSTGLVLSVGKGDVSTVVELVGATVQVNGVPAFDDLEEILPELFMA